MTVAEQHDKPVHLSDFAAAYGDQPFGAVGRTATFWRRASRIYFGYKSAQARAAWLGHPEKHVKQDFWRKHHTWAGAEMYSLAVDLRGFYLKVRLMVQSEVSVLYLQSATLPQPTHTMQVGQFLGARGDFVPVPTCQQLSRLHDQVRMPSSLPLPSVNFPSLLPRPS